MNIPSNNSNPYVGPRTFTRQEGKRFFGREREARDLFSLVVSERLVLFYAQSGAGKSSLINTRLIPQLQAAGFAVLPVGRVSGELPEGVSAVDNTFVFNLMLSLDQSEGDPQRFAHLPLTDFLARLTSDDGEHYYYYEAEAEIEAKAEAEAKVETLPLAQDVAVQPSEEATLQPVQDTALPAVAAALQPAQNVAEDEVYAEMPAVLIIDQFEEIITSHATRWPEREGFFRQLDEAMAANSLLWVVLSLREDFVASLDPYAPLLTSKLRARFYMQRMGYEAALEAIKKPAEQGGRPFAPGVAENLVDNLRQVRNQMGLKAVEAGVTSFTGLPSAESATTLGEFIEPVQLQVVCYQLWENLKTQPGSQITQQELQDLGNVDIALAQFYEQVIAEVISQTEVSEIDLRHWFEYQLITEVGTRGMVYRGKEQTGELANAAVDLLAAKFLIRAEVRTGGAWYELVHDRFVSPILEANLAWRLKQPLIQMAQDWAASGRSDGKLLEGQPLKDALAGNWQGLGPLVEAFLTAGEAAQKAKEEALRAEKQAQRQREMEARQKLAEERAQAAHQLAEIQRQRAEEQVEAAASLRQRAALLTIVGAIAIILAIIAGVFGWQSRQSANRAATQAADALAAQQEAEANATYAVSLRQTQQVVQDVGAASTVVQAKATQTVLAEQAANVQAALAGQFIAAEATSEAIALVPQPDKTPLPTPPSVRTVRPTGESGTSSGDSPETPETSTPTATATATDQLASAAQVDVAMLQAQATEIAVTQTALAQVAACPVEIYGEFVDLWDRYSQRLGCPEQASPVGGFFLEQPFERGSLYHAQILDLYIILIGDERSGTWDIIPSDTVREPRGGPDPNCMGDATPLPDLLLPLGKFSPVWCARQDIRQQIGWATRSEHGVSNGLLQQFKQGAIFRTEIDVVYVLFEDDRSYIRQ